MRVVTVSGVRAGTRSSRTKRLRHAPAGMARERFCPVAHAEHGTFRSLCRCLVPEWMCYVSYAAYLRDVGSSCLRVDDARGCELQRNTLFWNLGSPSLLDARSVTETNDVRSGLKLYQGPGVIRALRVMHTIGGAPGPLYQASAPDPGTEGRAYAIRYPQAPPFPRLSSFLLVLPRSASHYIILRGSHESDFADI